MRPDLMTCPMDEFMDALNEIDTSTAPHISKEEILAALPEADRGGTPMCERAVVASILENAGKRKYCDSLRGDEFSSKPLGSIFEMLMSMDRFVDLPIAVDEAEKRGLTRVTGVTGMGVYLASLLDSMYDPDNIEGYVSRVKRAAVARRVADGLEKMRMERARRMGL